MRILIIILGLSDASPSIILFKDDIHFRIANLSVYITNGVTDINTCM